MPELTSLTCMRYLSTESYILVPHTAQRAEPYAILVPVLAYEARRELCIRYISPGHRVGGS
eukprot:267846-Rhodomonas_salina.4